MLFYCSLKLFATILLALVVSRMIFSHYWECDSAVTSTREETNTPGNAAEPHEQEEEHPSNATTVRDSTAAILLSYETIAIESIIHLYNITPSII